MNPGKPIPPFWSLPLGVLLADLEAGPEGLSAREAADRLSLRGPNRLAPAARGGGAVLLLRQFVSPIILILTAAALLSFLLDSPTDGLIILGIVLISGLLGFWQERGAAQAVRQLLQTVESTTCVRRDGALQRIPAADLVPGDLLVLSAGAGIPADCRLIEERDLSLDEASLTGESFPVSKHPGVVAAAASLAERGNVLFFGTHVVSGTGTAVVVLTGADTAYGSIAARLRLRSPETEFERGVRQFGTLLLELTLTMVFAIFALNVYLQRPIVDSFLFSLALGVGLTPQLLPAIISVNLAQGAQRMAARRVIVKRLAAIENFGSMSILCSDKTGTLTEGSARLRRHCGIDGLPSERALLYAVINASFETGFPNPIDAGLRTEGGFDLSGWRKLDEIPFDFARKRQSILARSVDPAERDGAPVLITKGALQKVLEVCDRAECSDGRLVPLETVAAEIQRIHADWSGEGDRLLGVAIRRWEPLGSAVPLAVGRDAETAMIFLGMVALSDPLKPGIRQTVADLDRIGVRLKMITGDNALVAVRIARDVGLRNPEVLTGKQLVALSDAALPVRAQQVDVFAEIEPSQKERLIRALRQAGHVVGYIGDGINDAPALHAADVSLSVQGAVDVAREAADIVLLEADLAVLEAGIREGRRTFANTLKYVFMATSANFGNMFSMAGASLLLPFLPLLPKQILLTNLLTDLPEMTIATDRVDSDWIDRPRRWSIPFIKRFMLTFGLVSSVYDYLTFAVLLWVLHADAAQFRTGWFMESVISAASIVLVIRTRGPLFRSRPSRWLVAATLVVIGLTLILPWTPLGHLFGFVPLPAEFLLLLALILAAYIWSAELAKGWFYRQGGHFSPAQGLR
ncbi:MULTISPECIES: magnesium-translocating P-type ATPase [unclassified Synechococcus]|uniref:magnesium-translocating P-type ATPase n=1 Tax=unclassified Synechococcus TaxID=2626047 RepID=UPI0021A5AEF0|nr:MULTISPECIES: magnesium-translocating P-type ATPase [unclassified Synechococcus]MCT0213529.1 magnesium-translocating P-type ATPase [Synechococcus sp. CS-1326]MCT0234685.1 magnesium-translocating P-type ATPase [Synechococcus sp. CS-1327]